jgi:hypothetical protein
MTPSWCLKAIGEHELIFKLYIEENNKKKKKEFVLYFEVPKIFTKTKILAENLSEQEQGEENKVVL